MTVTLEEGEDVGAVGQAGLAAATQTQETKDPISMSARKRLHVRDKEMSNAERWKSSRGESK